MLPGFLTFAINRYPSPCCPRHSVGRFSNSAGTERLNDLARNPSLSVNASELQPGPPIPPVTLSASYCVYILPRESCVLCQIEGPGREREISLALPYSLITDMNIIVHGCISLKYLKSLFFSFLLLASVTGLSAYVQSF